MLLGGKKEIGKPFKWFLAKSDLSLLVLSATSGLCIREGVS